MLDQRESVAKRKFTPEVNTQLLSAVDEMADDQKEHKENAKKEASTETNEIVAHTPTSDRALRQMLLLIGIKAEFGDRQDLETIPNPKLLVLYYAIAKYVADYNQEHSAEQRSITFYSSIESATEALLQAVAATDDVVFYNGLGLFDLKPEHSVSVYVQNPEFIARMTS